MNIEEITNLVAERTELKELLDKVRKIGSNSHYMYVGAYRSFWAKELPSSIREDVRIFVIHKLESRIKEIEDLVNNRQAE